MVDCRKKHRVKLKSGEIVTVKIRKTCHIWYGERYFYNGKEIILAENTDYDLEQV